MKRIFLKYQYNKRAIYSIFFILNSFILILFFILSEMTNNIMTHSKHLTYSVANAKYLTVQSHLWLEEYLAGDKEEYAKVLKYLKLAKKEVNILIEGGVIRDIPFDSEHNSYEIENYLKKIKVELLDYENLLRKRIYSKEISDKQFDSQFDMVLTHLNQLDLFIQKKFVKVYSYYRNLKWGYLLLIIVLISFAFFMIVRFNRRLEKDIKVINRQAKRLESLNANLKDEVQKAIIKSKEDERTIFNQEKIIRMNELLRNIAHHWRQPLSAISGIVSSLKLTNQLGLLDKKTLDEDLTKALDQTEKLSSVINYFNETIKDDDKVSTTTIGEFINSFYFLVEKSIQNADIKIIKEIENVETSITLNTQRLTNVLLSLITNAVDVLTKREVKSGYIKLKTLKRDGYLNIFIEDNAGGIEEKYLNKIFEPYFTTEHQSEGKGLSLFVAYETISKDFGGEFNVRNSQKGARFHIKVKC